jgi:GNAT superfamily N-acetyltransferase
MTVIERSSGNVFRDLGLPNADELLAKAEADLELFRRLTPQMSVTERSILVNLARGPVSVATCSIDKTPEHWWVSRVFVRPKYRRHQLGSWCLSRALQLAEQQDGPDVVVVAPGGYNTPYAAQCAFYRRHGFEHDGRSDGAMVRQL